MSEPLCLWRMWKWDTVFIPVFWSKQMVRCSEWSHRFSRLAISHVNTENHRYAAIKDSMSVLFGSVFKSKHSFLSPPCWLLTVDQCTVGAEEYSALHRLVFLPVGGGGRGQLSVGYVPLVRERNWFQSPSAKRKCSEKHIRVVERGWRSQGVTVPDGWQRCWPLCILAPQWPQGRKHAPPLAFFRKSLTWRKTDTDWCER